MPLTSCNIGANGIKWPKCHIAPHSNCLDLENEWFHWWCHQHRVMVTLIPMASHDQEMQWCHLWYCWHYVMLQPMLSHDQRRYVASHFNCHYLRKRKMPFMMLLAWCDTDTDPIGIMWHQHQWNHMMPMSVNVMVTLKMLTAMCDSNISTNGMA